MWPNLLTHSTISKSNTQKQSFPPNGFCFRSINKMNSFYCWTAGPPNLRFCHSLPIKLPSPSHHLPHHRPHFPSLSDQPRASCRVIRASSSPSSMAEGKPFAVLFVCLGNICRSPAAEGVFADLVKKRGSESQFRIDSAGTIDYHEGNPADSRMRATSKKRGIEITSISRPIKPSDFNDFDLILAMDKQNRADILEKFNLWKFRDPLPEDAHKKVKLMFSYCKTHEETEVPDPYYGGQQGFEKVLDILEDACEHCWIH